MATTLVSLEEYLNTTFDPDCEFVDGVIVERNVGERPHSFIQTELTFFFRSMGRKGVFPYVEQRVQVKATRFRIPDLCVYVGEDPTTRIFRTPPFLVVEVLSRDDRSSDLQDKIRDYLEFGVRYIWVIDPEKRRAYIYTGDHYYEATGTLWTKDPDFEFPLDQLFQ